MEHASREPDAAAPPVALESAPGLAPLTAPEQVLALQRTAGNRAVTGLLSGGGESPPGTAVLARWEPDGGMRDGGVPDAGLSDAGAIAGVPPARDGGPPPDAGAGSPPAADAGAVAAPPLPQPPQTTPPPPAAPAQPAGGPDIGARQAPERTFEIEVPVLPEPTLTDLPATAALPPTGRGARAAGGSGAFRSPTWPKAISRASRRSAGSPPTWPP